MLKLTVTEARDDLPPFLLLLNYLGQVLILLNSQIHVTILLEIFDVYLLAIEDNFHSGIGDTRKIIGSFGHETYDIVFEFLHFEFLKVWKERHFGKTLLGVLRNHWILLLTHIFREHLAILSVLF